MNISECSIEDLYTLAFHVGQIERCRVQSYMLVCKRHYLTLVFKYGISDDHCLVGCFVFYSFVSEYLVIKEMEVPELRV